MARHFFQRPRFLGKLKRETRERLLKAGLIIFNQSRRKWDVNRRAKNTQGRL